MGQNDSHIIAVNNNSRTFCATADSKLEHQHATGQRSNISYSRQRQGNEVGENFSRLPYEISQFCELLNLRKLSKLCETLSMTKS